MHERVKVELKVLLLTVQVSMVMNMVMVNSCSSILGSSISHIMQYMTLTRQTGEMMTASG